MLVLIILLLALICFTLMPLSVQLFIILTVLATAVWQSMRES